MVDTRFQEQARAFITETLKDVIPGANVDSGSALNSLLARGGATITAGLMQEIEHVLKSRDLSDPASLSEADMDLLLENLLAERDGGSLAFGFVRLFYDTREQRVFEAGLTATNSDRSLSFVTLTDLVFNPQDYLLDARTGWFFINVPFTSVEAGDEYNVDPGTITQLTNDVSSPLRVTNVSRFQNGNPAQTNAQALRSAKRAVSTRTTLTTDGAVFFFQQQFGAKLKDMLIVGNGDDEMLRDEIYDLGATEEPRFRVGIGSLDPVTRAQLGSPQDLHIGGKTDLYMLFDSINYVQQTIDLFADTTLDSDTSAGAASITSTIISGTTGVVAASGKLIIELGGASEETVEYTSRVTADNNTFTFTLSGVTSVDHLAGASVKVVNNSDLSIGEDGDVTVLPVFQVAEVRILDPVTLQPIGSPIPETTAESPLPGWYFTASNRYDLLSARETKTLVIDEKSDTTLWPGNQALSGTNGGTSNIVIGSQTYTLYTVAGVDFTGYQGREIVLSGALGDITRTIIRVDSATQVVLSGAALTPSASGVDFNIAERFEDYNQYPVRLSFYTNTELQEAQQLVSDGSKRIITDDTLARSFLPVFLDFELRYRGDGEPADVRERVVEVLKTSSGDAIGESEGARFEYSDLINAAYEDDLANYVETPFEVRIRRQELDGSQSVRYVNPGANTVNRLAVRTAPAVTAFADDGATTASSNVFTTSTPLYVFSTADVGKRIWVEGTGIVTITAFVNVSQVETDTVFDSTSLTRDWSFVASFIEAKLPSTVSSFNIPTSGRLFLGGFSDTSQEVVTYESFVDLGNGEYTFIIAENEGIVFTHAANESMNVSVADYDPDNVITDGVITDERVYRPFMGNAVITKIGT